MQINPAEISDLLKAKIEKLNTRAEEKTHGTVISVTDLYWLPLLHGWLSV